MENKYEIIESLLYKGNEGAVTAEFLVDKKNQTFWASRKTVAEIFGTSGQNISAHFGNIFNDGELDENKVSISANELFKDQGEFSKEYLPNSKKGGRPEKWYNLDGIIAAGYRVNSKKATEFRIWATSILKEYVVKGFVLDDELLKNGSILGKDYFDELLEKIREIRTSERRFYQKVTDLYATADDYNKDAIMTRTFFAKSQNKIIYATTKKTAAELIMDRADSNKINMGLTTWKNSPRSKIHPSDIIISKNYLYEDELDIANRLVEGFLNAAEMRVKQNQKTNNPMYMKDWDEFLDEYIDFNKMGILEGSGKVSSKQAHGKAKKEYEVFRKLQDVYFKSDYDNLLEEIEDEIKRIERNTEN